MPAKRLIIIASLFCIVFGATEFAQARTKFEGSELEALADEYFEEALAKKRMTGASVGFVQDGEVIFLKGYGWEDQQAGIPLDPEQTRFRMCSTSKTVTATALMQLVERGQIDSLDDPINKYLKRYQLPPPYGDQVTFKHLMTHSSGMAGHATPQGTKQDIPVPVDGKTVQHFFRENIERPPGAVGAYANLGVALESVALEDITGTPLANYVAKEIFVPLGMGTALFHHALQKPPHLAQPYGVYPDGSLQEVRFYPKHPLTAASGGFITTTKDMLKYAALHADEEAMAYADVLSSDGRKTLHARHFSNHPSDPGMGLHFYRDYYGDELMVSHGCGLPGTSSLMGVFPNSNAAFVVTILSASVTPGIGDLIGKLFGTGPMVETEDGPGDDRIGAGGFLPKAIVGDKSWPEIDAASGPAAMEIEHSKLAGTYWGERRAFNSFAKVFSTSTTKVSLGEEDGELLMGDQRYLRIAPGVYQSSEKPNRLFFKKVGENETIFMQTHPSFAYRQVHGFGNPTLSMSGLLISFALSLTGFLALAWKRGGGRWENAARRLSVLMALSVVAVPVVLFAGYERILDIALIDYFNGDLTRALTLIVLFNVHFLLGLGVVWAACIAWSRGLFGSGRRALLIRSHLAVLALAAVAGWPGMFFFNLLGLQQ